MERISPDAAIYVAGDTGLVGSALVRRLEAAGYQNILKARSGELDLRDQDKTRVFFERTRPDYVIMAAAKVGGIYANSTYPADFVYDNIMIQTNVIDSAHRNGVKKTVFLGSTCIYPKMAPQPIKEEYLLTGPLEPTNEAYAIAKIAGLKMCEAYGVQHGFRSVTLMPTNLYGPNDNFDLKNSHVAAALLRKAHEAKVEKRPALEVWGSGTPLREFLHVDDMADAAIFCLTQGDHASMLNVGSGDEVSIADLARLICDVVGYEGELVFDPSKPDGTPRKLADTSRLFALGWKPKISLRDGLEQTYAWYLQAHG